MDNRTKTLNLTEVDDGALLSDKEIRSALSITHQTLWRWRKRGVFPKPDIAVLGTKRTTASLVKRAVSSVREGEAA